MIAGAPGVGKSEAMWAFKREVPSAIVVTAVCQEGGTWNLANKLCKVLDLGEPNSRRMPETRIKIAEEIGQGGFLMIDEAQHLVQENPRGQNNWGALEWARGMAEEGCFGLALIGDLKLLNGLDGAPQLRRRTHPRVVIRQATEEDVASVCHACGVSEPKIIQVLTRAAKAFGGLGDVIETIRTARDMNADGNPLLDDFLASLEFLDLAKG